MVSENQKRGRGRPDLGYNLVMKIRMPIDLYDELCKTSVKTQESINQLMVNAIEEKYCEYESEMKKRMKLKDFLDNLP